MSLLSLTPLKGVSAPWTPASKSGGLFWFDVSNAGSVTKDGSNRISQLTNLFGNSARNATQSTDANKPVWTSSQLNGLPGAVFTASSSQRMGFGTDDLVAAGSPFSVVAVVKNTSVGGTWYHSITSIKASAANRAFLAFFTNDASYADLAFNIVNNPSQTGVRVSGTFSSASAIIFNYNGGAVATTSSWAFYQNNSSITVNTGAGGIGTGSANWLGAFNATPALFGNITLFEIFAYDSQLSAGDLASIATYMSTKWGL